MRVVPGDKFIRCIIDAPINRLSMLTYIFGSISLLLGSGLFFLAARSMVPPKPGPDTNESNSTSNANNYEWLMIPAILLILNGMYDLFWSDSKRYTFMDRPKKEMWTPADSTFLVQKCIKEYKGMAVLYRKATVFYCTCAASKIMNAMSKEEFQALSKESEVQQSFIVSPIVEDCHNVSKGFMKD